MAHRSLTTHPLVLRHVRVARVVDVTPRMRRVTLAGPQLAAFERDGMTMPPFTAPGFDDHVKLIFAADGDIETALPTQLAHGIEWGPAPHRQGRDYTPRRVDLEAGEVDLDFVLHGDGPAAGFARDARPGDGVWFVGPKSSSRLPDGIDAVLLAGDETALPAIGRFLDERPTQAPAHVVVTVADPVAQQPLALREGDTIRWVVAQEGHPTALADAVRAVPLTSDSYAWAAAESRSLLPLRRYLTRELALPRTHIDVTGYWHAEQRERADGGTLVEAPAGVPSPLGWFVTRASVQLGLLDVLLDGGPLATEVLAERTGVAIDHLAALLPVLEQHGVLRVDGGTLSLGQVGLDILEDEHEREEYEGHHADELLALAALAPALRGRTSAWRQHYGRTLAQTAAADPEVNAELVEHSEVLAYVLHGLTDDLLGASTDRVLVTGPGAGTVVDHLIQRSETWRARLRTVEGPADGGHQEEVLLAALALGHRTDEEALAALTGWRASGLTRVVLVEDSRPDGLGPGAVESALRTLAATGAPPRDHDALSLLAGRAGWRACAPVPLGWGIEATVLEPSAIA